MNPFQMQNSIQPQLTNLTSRHHHCHIPPTNLVQSNNTNNNHHNTTAQQLLQHHLLSSQYHSCLSRSNCSFNNNYNEQQYLQPQPLMAVTCMNHQQLNHSSTATLNQPHQQPTTSAVSINSSTQHAQHQQNQQRLVQLLPQSEVVPMDSDIVDDFTLVSRKKKKTKTDHNQPNTTTPTTTTSTSSGTTSSSSINTNSSTSSSNSDSSGRTCNVLPPQHLNQNEQVTFEDQDDVTFDARRFAQTRFAFPPFIVKFDHEVDEQIIIKDLIKHFSSTYNVNLRFCAHRLRRKKELVLFVEDRRTFISLYNINNWPTTINSFAYDKILPSHLPPQFSIILRNVPTDENIIELLEDIKKTYPNVCNATRLVNSKTNAPTSLIRLDINCCDTIIELLNKKHIYLNNMRFTISEYLAPAKVLICTKCFQIGHFRRTCTSKLDTCKICGQEVPDISQHKSSCNNSKCCIRCNGDHDAGDLRCPKVKTYRAKLTSLLLANHANSNNHQHQQQFSTNTSKNYWLTDQEFPVMSTRNNNNQLVNDNLNRFDNQLDMMNNKLNLLQGNVEKIIAFQNNTLDQYVLIQQIVAKQEHELQLQRYDVTFLKDFISQFITPLCQTWIDIIPILVKKKVINDKTMTNSSLIALSEKLADDLTSWTKRYTQNEEIKAKLNYEFSQVNTNPPNAAENNTNNINHATQDTNSNNNGTKHKINPATASLSILTSPHSDLNNDL